MGRPIQTLADDVAFWVAAGYDYIPLFTDLFAAPQIQDNIGVSLPNTAQLFEGRKDKRDWISSGAEVVKTWDDVERFPWPTAGDVDYSPYRQVERYLPPGMKVVVTCGHIFTTAWSLKTWTVAAMSDKIDELLERES